MTRALLLAVLMLAMPAVAHAQTTVAEQQQWLDPEADTGQHDGIPGDGGPQPLEAEPGPLPPSRGGQWVRPANLPDGFNPIHAVQGRNGLVLLIAGSGNVAANLLRHDLRSYVYNPRSGQFRFVRTPADMFCAGHVLLPDGRALVAGGTTSYGPFRGAAHAYAFNFRTLRYDVLPPMHAGRWYPAATTMRDGTTLLSGGVDGQGNAGRTSEVFDWRAGTMTLLPGSQLFPNYAGLHVVKGGGLFYSGAASGNPGVHPPGFWDPMANTFRPVGGLALPDRRVTASSCFVGDVRDQNLIIVGGGWPATNTTAVIDLDAASPRYRPGPPLAVPKGYPSCTSLPDGSLMEAGGGGANRIGAATTEASILRSVGGRWTPVNPLPAGEHRLYHSFLCPLDDGSVLSLTSNPRGDPWSRSVLIYRPPYMFRGPRPVIRRAPQTVTYGGRYAITAGPRVTHVAITSAPSPTHSHDANQRYVRLRLQGGAFTMPPSGDVLPVGWYRLWAIGAAGQPSTARWVHLG